MIDIIGIIIILLFFIRGYFKGFIMALFSVLAILLGLLCALKLSEAFSSWLLSHKYISSGWVQVISYVVLFIVVVLLVRLLGKLIQTAVEGIMLGIVNKLIGGLLYAFLGAVFWSSLLWIGNRMHILTPESIAQSKTYPFLSRIAPWFFQQAGKLLPFARDTFSHLGHFFDSFNQKSPADVVAH